MNDWRARLDKSYKLFAADIQSLLNQEPVALSEADIPAAPGIYMFVYEGETKYIGEAKGSGGLKDRVLSKHVSGDDRHTLQRIFKEALPDRSERRKFIKSKILVKWVVISDSERVALVERLAIWLFNPPWNRM